MFRPALLLLLFIASCTEPAPQGRIYTLYATDNAKTGGGERAQVVRPQQRNSAEMAFVRGLLDNLQRRSIAENREYCGFIGLNPDGEITATNPVRGEPARCDFVRPPANLRLIASYHTHAAFDPIYDNEVPSVQDLAGDIRDHLDGYISTPGGRIWYDNAREGTATLQCGLACVYYDPNFHPDYRAPVNRSGYTLEALKERHG